MSIIDRFLPGRGQRGQPADYSAKESGHATNANGGGTHVTIGAAGTRMSMEQVLGAVGEGMQGHTIASMLAFISPNAEVGIAPVDVICKQQGLGDEVRDTIVQLALNQAFGVQTPMVQEMRDRLEQQRAEEDAKKIVEEWNQLPRRVRALRIAGEMVGTSVRAVISPFTIGAEIRRLGSDEPDHNF